MEQPRDEGFHSTVPTALIYLFTAAVVRPGYRPFLP